DGEELRAGELLARANRVTHGLRTLGLGQGDVVTTVLPNGAPMIELYLACAQAGMYLVPINHHLTGPEIAYIVKDSGAKVFVGSGRFADTCRAAADEIGFPAAMRFAVGDVPGFRPYADLTAGQRDGLPDDRTAGQVMNYTPGPTGRPKGVRRPLVPFDPDTVFSMFGMFLGMFGIQPKGDDVHICGSPLYHTAVL